MVESAVREEAKRPDAKQADLYSWARRQAGLLRAGRLSEIDAAAIADEIDDVGEEQYDKLESALRVLMLHLVKWDHQPSMRSRSWTLTIREQRRRAERQLRKNPGLNSQVDEALGAAYEDARLEAANETGLPLSRIAEKWTPVFGLKSCEIKGSKRDCVGSPTKSCLGVFPAQRPFEHEQVMQRSIVWPGDED